jgi:hypothetical protein
MWDDLESPKELDIVSDNERMRKYTGDRIFKCIKPVKEVAKYELQLKRINLQVLQNYTRD